MKTCARCKVLKEIVGFSKNPQQKDGYHVYCKECVSKYHKKYYTEHREELIERERQRRATDPEKHKQYHRDYRINFPERIRNSRLLKAYGITVEEWEKLFELQERKCAICKTTDPGIKGWDTDHKHGTKIVRGILCTSCNNGLGRFKDNIEYLQTAVEYLLRNKQNEVVVASNEESSSRNYVRARPERHAELGQGNGHSNYVSGACMGK